MSVAMQAGYARALCLALLDCTETSSAAPYAPEAKPPAAAPRRPSAPAPSSPAASPAAPSPNAAPTAAATRVAVDFNNAEQAMGFFVKALHDKNADALRRGGDRVSSGVVSDLARWLQECSGFASSAHSLAHRSIPMISRSFATTSLRRLFLTLARGAAASSTLAGCAAEHGAGGRSDGWKAVTCSENVASLGTLALTEQVEHLSIYWVYPDVQGLPLPDGTRQQFPTPRARTGVLCAESNAFPGCASASDVLIKHRCSVAPCGFALLQQGTSFRRIDDREELLALLGAVDTPSEAVLLTAFDGPFVCSEPDFDDDPHANEIGARVRGSALGYEVESTYQSCGAPLYRTRWSISAQGEVAELERETLAPPTCTPGRRPPGLCEANIASSARAGAFLAECARLEHASVYAFHQLERELEAHAAPASLRRRAREAMFDEVRHTRTMGELARAYGAAPRAAEVEPTRLRSLFEIAVDNATEGCLRETFSALLATYQAESARDERVRSALAEIARDETRHAGLSWQLMAWLTPQLSDTQRAYVREAQRQTAAELVRGDACSLTPEERALLGLPESEVCKRLARELVTALLGEDSGGPCP